MTDPTRNPRSWNSNLPIWTSARTANVYQKIDTLNDLAWKLSDIDLKRAYALSETAYALACTPADGDSAVPGRHGVQLAHLGYLNQRLGNHPLGLSQLLQALEICEALSLDDALPDVLDGIAGIYSQIGDFPEALGYIHRQLAAAQQHRRPTTHCQRQQQSGQHLSANRRLSTHRRNAAAQLADCRRDRLSRAWKRFRC